MEENTVKIKLPDKKIIDIKTSLDATFKEFLEAALTQYPEIKKFGYVKFEYKCNIWDINESWVQAQDRLKQKQTLVFNKRTLKEEEGTINTSTKTMSIGKYLFIKNIGKYLFIKNNAELSLILAEDDPCAINLNNLEETDIQGNKLPINIQVYDGAGNFLIGLSTTNPNDTFGDVIREACHLHKRALGKFSRVKFVLKTSEETRSTLQQQHITQTVSDLFKEYLTYSKFCRISIEACGSKDKDDEYTVNLDDFRNAKKVDEKADSELINLKPIDEDLYSEQKKNDSNEKIVINNASPKKINWPRIIVGILTLFLLAATIVLFLLFFLSSLNIPLTAPIISAVVSFVCFTIWSLWNNIVPKNFEGGIIYKPLSENDIDIETKKLSDLSNPKLYHKENNDFNLE